MSTSHSAGSGKPACGLNGTAVPPRLPHGHPLVGGRQYDRSGL